MACSKIQRKDAFMVLILHFAEECGKSTQERILEYTSWVTVLCY